MTALVALGRDGAVVVGDDVVVRRADALHRLNPTAARVWARCDGTVGAAEIAEELAAVFATGATGAVDAATVRADVERTVAELTRRGLVQDAGTAAAPPPIPLIEPPVECTGCGDGPGYAARVLVQVDDGLLGIGADRAFAPELAAAFGGRAAGVREEPGRASYGVVLPDRNASGVQPISRLYRGPDLLARSRGPEPVVDALIARVGAHALPAGHGLLDAVAVGRDGRVVLVPVPANRVAFERMAERLGLATAPGSVVVVDPAGPTATVGAPWLGVDRERLLRAVATRAHVGAAPPVLAPGDHEIVAVAASEPRAATAFGELAPPAGPGADDVALDLLRSLCARVPVLAADDLAGISRRIGGAPPG